MPKGTASGTCGSIGLCRTCMNCGPTLSSGTDSATIQSAVDLGYKNSRARSSRSPAQLPHAHTLSTPGSAGGSIRPWEIVRRFAPFRYKMFGQLAVIGRERGVTSILDLRSRAFLRGFLWQSVYLIKVPKCR
jgi:NADH dehydrogenase FAD-containing subunit